MSGSPRVGLDARSAPVHPRGPDHGNSLAVATSLAIFHKLARHPPTSDDYERLVLTVNALYDDRLRKAKPQCPVQTLLDLRARTIRLRGIFDVCGLSAVMTAPSIDFAPLMPPSTGLAHLMRSLRRYKRVVLFKNCAGTQPGAWPARTYATILSTDARGRYAIFCKGQRQDVLGATNIWAAVEELLSRDFTYLTFRFK
jgi:hypothetical protein